MKGDEGFDYVVIGAGSGGCAVAARLAEDEGCRILVVEAGGSDRDPWIGIPLAWGRNAVQRRHDWMYESEPQASLGGRRVAVFRGKVLGGSSSINAMAYVRGHRGDYERWAVRYGLRDWSYDHVLPYFRKQESWEEGASVYRGGDGPLTVCRPVFPDPLNDAFAAAGLAAGHPWQEDYNGAEQEGFTRVQSTIRKGRRCSAAVAYLGPVMSTGRVQVLTGTLVTRIVIERGRAVGVEMLRSGKILTARADREVIVSAGTINSPQLLMLSGIGDPEALRQLDIPVSAAVKGVGANLQDHVAVGIDCRRKEPGTLHRALRADRIGLELLRAHFLGTGIAATVPSVTYSFLRSDPAEPIPDLQIPFRAFYDGARPYLPPFSPAFDDGFGCTPVLLRPESRGTISLASRDPRMAPRLQPNLLSTDRDWEVLRRGIRIACDVLEQPALHPFLASYPLAGGGRRDADLDDFIRTKASIFHHALGTCRMGTDGDEMAVVDDRLRVRGVQGLRIVDAAVMPDLIGGNINAAVIMIAEKAADLIRGRTLLPPAQL